MRRWFAIFGLCALVVGCASSVDGSGTGNTPSDSSPTSVASSAASTPSTSVPPGPSSATITVPSSPPPNEATPPDACAANACEQVGQADLDGDFAAVLYRAAGRGARLDASVVALIDRGVPVHWTVIPDEYPGELACSGAPIPNCLVEGSVGAHSSVATGFTRSLDRLEKFGEVLSDTPTMDVIDLNGDGLIDAVTVMNTYDPSYATGKVYWETFQSSGTGFRPTGCTAPKRELPPQPTVLLTGQCPP